MPLSRSAGGLISDQFSLFIHTKLASRVFYQSFDGKYESWCALIDCEKFDLDRH